MIGEEDNKEESGSVVDLWQLFKLVVCEVDVQMFQMSALSKTEITSWAFEA